VEIVETPAPPQDTPTLDREEIRRRAYELSLQDPDASPMDNWLRAESELLAIIQMSVYTHP
jgi:hypothetical protein